MRIIPTLALLSALAAKAQVSTLAPLTVTATRAPEPLSAVPFTVDTVRQDALGDSASFTVDDALRGSADFSLFRRSDSLTANPTTQGVSLRGLGPSGASRSLVLLDGVPLNDPFGGWVPWSSVPADSLQEAEVVPGGGAAAWGNEALAGVIQLFSKDPQPGNGSAALRLGDFGTASAELSQAVRAGPGTLDLRGETFTTEGTGLVAASNRGPVDTDASMRHNAESARWLGKVSPLVGMTVTLRRSEEWRDNGTPYQQNHLRLSFGSVILRGVVGPDLSWTLATYAQDQNSSQAFSSVNAARTSETPASLQFAVPASAFGVSGSARVQEPSGASTTFGGDLRSVAGETREDFLYSKGAYTEQRFAGGRQAFAGLFAERLQPLAPGLSAMVGARIDRWQDTDGHLRTTALATGALLTESLYPDRSGTELSPSAGLTWAPTPELSLHMAGQHASRQPTLNELYRPFRQGNTTTLANPLLLTEHADTAELGARWDRGRLSLSVTAFAARLDDPVSNVTLAQGPGSFPLFGILAAGSTGQERLNLGRVDTKGLQLGARWSLARCLDVDASAVCESATVGSAPVAPGLVGRSVPEVPRWNASLRVSWQPVARVFLVLRARAASSQYDDDQNLLRLAPYAVADASVRFLLSESFELFGAVDNLGDARVETARSALGVFNVAPGRAGSAGVRLSW